MSSSRFHHHHNNNNNRITSTITTTIIIILVTCCTNPAHGFFGEWGPDLAGPWCATRAPGEQCCVGRDDICSVPILKTECYCDIFCNQKAYDCCPDYWGHCHHQVRNNITFTPATTLPPPRSTRPPPQAPCFRDGRIHMPGETIQENCNNCTCVFHEFSGSQFVCTDEVCLVRPEVIRHVNDGPYTWKASNYSQFWGLTLQHGISHRLGTFLLSGHVVDMTPLRVRDDVLPESFDARDKWRGLIHPITDQGDCASSWAHSTTAVASDRLSIETEGSIHPRLSPQNLLSCDLVKQHGCQGGHLDRAWWYLRKRGVVTEDCYPYVSGKTRESGTCLVSRGQMSASCPSGQTWKSGARYKATPPYRIRPLEREIMKEIMDNGPVQATILVHEDFFVYSRGIYRHQDVSTLRGESSAHRQAGFHSVRIVGWGAERSVQGDIIKYWTCANSWGVNWGEDGFFRIVRGSDESRIERYVLGVWGKISGDRELRKVLEENRRRRLRSQRANRQPRHLITGRQRRRRHLHHKHHLQQQQQQQQSQQAHRLHPQQHTPLHQMDTARWNTNTNNNQQQLLYKYKNKSKKHKKGKKNNTNKKNKKNKKNKNKKNKYKKHHFSQFYNSVNLQDLESYFPGFKH